MSLLSKSAYDLLPEGLRLLRRYGADLSSKEERMGLLHWAACGGDQEYLHYEGGECEATLRLLASWGLDLNATDSDGRTPLYRAASGGELQEEALRTLLDLGSEVDSGDDGDTPFLRAAIRGNVEAMNILLDAGANPDRRDEDGVSALDHGRDHLAYSIQRRDETEEWAKPTRICIPPTAPERGTKATKGSRLSGRLSGGWKRSLASHRFPKRAARWMNISLSAPPASREGCVTPIRPAMTKAARFETNAFACYRRCTQRGCV